MKIRQAARKDCERIVKELWLPFIRYHSKLDKFSVLDKKVIKIFYNHLCNFVKDPNNVIFIAEEGPSIIGYIKATKTGRSPVYKIKVMGEISDICVLSSHRKKHVGLQLVRKAEQWFKKKGLKFVWLKVHSRNKLGNFFWEKLGYDDYMVEKMKTLR